MEILRVRQQREDIKDGNCCALGAMNALSARARRYLVISAI